MSRINDRQVAIQLRQQGKTYSEIRQEVKVAKSTLSEWLKNFPLSEEQLQKLNSNRLFNKQVAIEKTRNIKQKKREKRLKTIYQQEKGEWGSLSIRELILAGLFLYWGEGNKSLRGSLSLNNSDPKVLQFTLRWLTDGLYIPKEKIGVYLHLYSDMSKEKEIKYWSELLNIPRTQFLNPYVKESRRVDLTHKGFGHGTCGLVVHNIRIKEKVIMAINAIADSYSGKL